LHCEPKPNARITELEARWTPGSRLPPVFPALLAGLTRVELGFALALVVAASGLVLALGLVERRRTFALAAALGASPRQLAGLLWSEASVVVIGGLLAGAVIDTALSQMLVAVLTCVFDPPPAQLAVPCAYLGAVGALAVVAVGVAAAGTGRLLRQPVISQLREP
jgi:putative ABC transport system permease protein